MTLRLIGSLVDYITYWLSIDEEVLCGLQLEQIAEQMRNLQQTKRGC